MVIEQHRWLALAALAPAIIAFTSPASADPGLVVQCDINSSANGKVVSSRSQFFYIDFDTQKFCFDSCYAAYELRTKSRQPVDLSWRSGVSDGPIGEEIVLASANYPLEYDRAGRNLSGNGSGSGLSRWAVAVDGKCVENTNLPEPVRSFLKIAKANPAPNILPIVR